MNKLGSKGKIIALVAVIVVLIGGVYGYKSYKNQPDHNPNNPLNGVDVTFSRQYGPKNVSDTTQTEVLRNIIVIMLKKEDPDSELINLIENSKHISTYFPSGGEKDMHDDLLGSDETDSGYDYKFTDQETRMLDELRHVLYERGGDTVVTTPSAKHVNVGDTVEAKPNLSQEFADKYGISLTPKKVKVEKIPKNEYKH